MSEFPGGNKPESVSRENSVTRILRNTGSFRRLSFRRSDSKEASKSQDPVVMQGWLRKMKRNKKSLQLSEWNKRYFQVQSGNLYWSRSNASDNYSGKIPLLTITKLKAFEKGQQGTFSFVISCDERSMLLRAETKGEMDKWVRGLQLQMDLLKGGSSQGPPCAKNMGKSMWQSRDPEWNSLTWNSRTDDEENSYSVRSGESSGSHGSRRRRKHSNSQNRNDTEMDLPSRRRPSDELQEDFELSCSQASSTRSSFNHKNSFISRDRSQSPTPSIDTSLKRGDSRDYSSGTRAPPETRGDRGSWDQGRQRAQPSPTGPVRAMNFDGMGRNNRGGGRGGQARQGPGGAPLRGRGLQAGVEMLEINDELSDDGGGHWGDTQKHKIARSALRQDNDFSHSDEEDKQRHFQPRRRDSRDESYQDRSRPSSKQRGRPSHGSRRMQEDISVVDDVIEVDAGTGEDNQRFSDRDRDRMPPRDNRRPNPRSNFNNSWDDEGSMPMYNHRAPQDDREQRHSRNRDRFGVNEDPADFNTLMEEVLSGGSRSSKPKRNNDDYGHHSPVEQLDDF